MDRSEQINELAAALVLVQGTVAPAVKGGYNPHFKKNYTTLEDVWDACREQLTKNKIAVYQNTEFADDAGVNVGTMLLHASGQYLYSAIRIPIDKANAQAIGSAITYGRRYGLASAVGVVADDDDDGNEAVVNAPNTQRYPSGAVKQHDDGEKTMPFGDHKGLRLKDLDDAVLQKCVDWCRSKDAKKFSDLITSCLNVMSSRSAKSGGLPTALLDSDEPDGLPFS